MAPLRILRMTQQISLNRLCEEKGAKYQDVLDLLDLYNADAPEDEILDRIALYPIPARELVANLILPQPSE
jgi:hypothetical protein